MALLISLLLACSWGEKSPDGALTSARTGVKPDVIVVTLDTTRADRLGAYGYAGAKTDTIDALAAAGTRFTNAYSPLPLTIPAHSTLFTGLLPYHHHVRGNGDNVLSPEFTTLAEHMKAAGYRTGAAVAAFVTTRQWGFSQGFDAYFDTLPDGGDEDPSAGPRRNKNFWHTERPGAEVVDDALAWLAEQPADKPVFLWVHLYDAHFPYIQHPEYGDTFKDKPYDGELAYVDDQVGRLRAAVEGRDVLWALVGDHGEALGEHGESSHGLYAYNPTAHVPFILSGAGVPAAVVTDPVSTADLTPTLLRLLGLPIPDGLDGKPQPGSPTVPYIESYELASRFEVAPHRAVVSDGYKLIATPRPELYDQSADPGEVSNLADQKPDQVARLQKLLDEKGATPPGAGSSEIDAATVSQLAALGYISPGDASGLDFAKLPDPKDKRTALDTINRLDSIQRSQGPQAVLDTLDTIIPELPRGFELRMRRINALGALKRQDEIKPYVEGLAQEFPTKARIWITLASMAAQDKDLAQALEYAERAVQVEPTNSGAQEAVVDALLELGRGDEAVARGEAWMKENPLNYGVAALLGQHFMEKADFTKAEEWLRVAIAGPNPRRAARAELAVLAGAAGFPDDAIVLLEGEVKDYPGNLFARRLLAKFYGDKQRWLDEKAQLQWVLRVRPHEVRAIVAIAQCDFNLGDYRLARTGVDQALGLAPEDPDVLLLHANLLAKEGKKDEGYAVFQKAVALKKKQAEAEGRKIVVTDAGDKPAAGDKSTAGDKSAAGAGGAAKAGDKPAGKAGDKPAGKTADPAATGGAK